MAKQSKYRAAIKRSAPKKAPALRGLPLVLQQIEQGVGMAGRLAELERRGCDRAVVLALVTELVVIETAPHVLDRFPSAQREGLTAQMGDLAAVGLVVATLRRAADALDGQFARGRPPALMESLEEFSADAASAGLFGKATVGRVGIASLTRRCWTIPARLRQEARSLDAYKSILVALRRNLPKNTLRAELREQRSRLLGDLLRFSMGNRTAPAFAAVAAVLGKVGDLAVSRGVRYLPKKHSASALAKMWNRARVRAV